MYFQGGSGNRILAHLAAMHWKRPVYGHINFNIANEHCLRGANIVRHKICVPKSWTHPQPGEYQNINGASMVTIIYPACGGYLDDMGGFSYVAEDMRPSTQVLSFATTSPSYAEPGAFDTLLTESQHTLRALQMALFAIQIASIDTLHSPRFKKTGLYAGTNEADAKRRRLISRGAINTLIGETVRGKGDLRISFLDVYPIPVAGRELPHLYPRLIFGRRNLEHGENFNLVTDPLERMTYRGSIDLINVLCYNYILVYK